MTYPNTTADLQNKFPGFTPDEVASVIEMAVGAFGEASPDTLIEDATGTETVSVRLGDIRRSALLFG